VVVVREREDGEKRLVAYVVGGGVSVSELSRYMKEKIPEDMVAGTIVKLGKMPLTEDGKIDRKRLAEGVGERKSGEGWARPRTPVEEAVAGIWRDVLGVKEVGIRDNFFELGGHSLLATQVISRIRRVLQVQMGMESIFEHPTIAEMSEEIEKEMRAGQGLEA